MDRRLVAVLILAVAAVGGLAAFLLLRDDGDGTDPALAAMSTRGRPIEFPVPERLGPWGDVTREAIMIAERDGIRFLRLPRKDGSSCWAMGERRSGFWSITQFSCETGFLRFPDPKRPVMVTGRLFVEPGTTLTTYQVFGGFAADAVKRIAVLDRADRVVPVATVTDNVFYSPTPPRMTKRLLALDEQGAIIWRGPEVQLPDE